MYKHIIRGGKHMIKYKILKEQNVCTFMLMKPVEFLVMININTVF